MRLPHIATFRPQTLAGLLFFWGLLGRCAVELTVGRSLFRRGPVCCCVTTCKTPSENDRTDGNPNIGAARCCRGLWTCETSGWSLVLRGLLKERGAYPLLRHLLLRVRRRAFTSFACAPAHMNHPWQKPS